MDTTRSIEQIEKRTILITVIGIGIFLSLSNLKYHKWNDMVTGGGDSWGYYVYLPALFINHDLKDLQTTCATKKKYHPDAGGCRTITKYSSGVAIMHLPAFALAHAFTSATDYDTDGFSKPYIFALYLSTLLYVLLGLYLLGLVLIKEFDQRSVITTLVLLAICTNLYYFSSYNNVMSHPITFFFTAALIYTTNKFYAAFRWREMVLIGLLLGMITLIRPTNIILALIPFLWSFDTIKNRFALIVTHASKLPVALIAFFISLLPQLLYWKYTSGQFIYYSYTGEGFDFANSMIGRGLFSFRNGWLAYTPIMFFVFPGLFILWKNKSRAFLTTVLILPLHVYIIYSWWNWYYINGLGSRPMVDIYPILAFALAGFISFTFKKTYLRIPFIIIASFFSALNIFQLYQHSKGILWTEDAHTAYYKQSFGQTKWKQDMSVAYDLKEYQPKSYTLKRLLYKDEFRDYAPFEVAQTRRDGRASVLLSQESIDSLMTFEIPVSELQLLDNEMLTIKIWMRVEKQMVSLYDFSSLIVEQWRDAHLYKRYNLRLHNKPCPEITCSLWYGEVHVWDELVAHIRPHDSYQEGDRLRFRFNVPEKATPLFLSSFELYVSEKD